MKKQLLENTGSAIRAALICLIIVLLLAELKSCIHEVNALCRPKPKSEVQRDTVIKYKYMVQWLRLEDKRPQPKDSTPSQLPIKIDTLAVVNSFFKEYLYNDTIQDSNLIAISSIRIFQNKIKSYQLRYKLLQPVKEVTITNTIQEPARPLFLAGFSANLNNNTIIGFGPDVVFVTRKKRAIGLGYDLLNKSCSIKMYLPIRVK